MQCKKEAKFVAVVWIVSLFYCVGTIVSLGYPASEDRPDVPNLIFGMPAWVFWGLWLPWLVLIGITWWFALRVLKDDEPFAAFPDEIQNAD